MKLSIVFALIGSIHFVGSVSTAEDATIFHGRLFDLGKNSLSVGKDSEDVGYCTVSMRKSYDIREDGGSVNGVPSQIAYVQISMTSDRIRKANFENHELGVSLSTIEDLFDSEYYKDDRTLTLRGKSSEGLHLEVLNTESFDAMMSNPQILSVVRYKDTFFKGYFSGTDSYKWAYACVVNATDM